MQAYEYYCALWIGWWCRLVVQMSELPLEKYSFPFYGETPFFLPREGGLVSSLRYVRSLSLISSAPRRRTSILQSLNMQWQLRNHEWESGNKYAPLKLLQMRKSGL